MCHDEWFWRRFHEREASRRLWEEFEQTRPLSDPEPTEQETEITLEHPEPRPVAAEH